MASDHYAAVGGVRARIRPRSGQIPRLRPGERAWSDMTGTLPAYRGRGFARLAKQHTLVAAAGAGVTRAMAGNDDANAPMVAVNRSLGYAVFVHAALGVRALP